MNGCHTDTVEPSRRADTITASAKPRPDAPRACPAWLIAGAASGQGKTTVTAALARYHRDLGRRVRIFKCGPDFLDPMVLEMASGAPVYNLDPWMGDTEHCRALLYAAAGDTDLLLIEGVMGLFDGSPSSADIAETFQVPVLAVIDGGAMAQTFGAVAHGLARYRPGLPFAGVFANNVAGAAHYEMLAQSLPDDLPCLGWLPHDNQIAVPERYLGLQQAHEIGDLYTRLALSAGALRNMSDALPPVARFPPPIQSTHGQRLAGLRIGIARDPAFAFLYHANLDVLRQQGARLDFFSPLSDRTPPAVDALYFPGGYPELHLERLAANRAMHQGIRAFHDAGKPIVAECGGMLYLATSLSDTQGHRADLVGLLPGEASVAAPLANLGLHRVTLPEGELRGHTFHHSHMRCALDPIAHTEGATGHGRPEAVYRLNRLTTSYLHFYFPSNPDAAAGLFAP